MSEPHIKTHIAARRLDVCVETIKRWLKAGRMRGTKTGGGFWRIPESEVSRLRSKSRNSRNTPTSPRP